MSKRLVSKEKAEQDYGVIVGNAKASERLRKKCVPGRRRTVFLTVALHWAALESPEEARQRVREHGDRQTHPETGVMHHPG